MQQPPSAELLEHSCCDTCEDFFGQNILTFTDSSLAQWVSGISQGRQGFGMGD